MNAGAGAGVSPNGIGVNLGGWGSRPLNRGPRNGPLRLGTKQPMRPLSMENVGGSPGSVFGVAPNSRHYQGAYDNIVRALSNSLSRKQNMMMSPTGPYSDSILGLIRTKQDEVRALLKDSALLREHVDDINRLHRIIVTQRDNLNKIQGHMLGNSGDDRVILGAQVRHLTMPNAEVPSIGYAPRPNVVISEMNRLIALLEDAKATAAAALKAGGGRRTRRNKRNTKSKSMSKRKTATKRKSRR
jgi:hypothetical protein